MTDEQPDTPDTITVKFVAAPVTTGGTRVTGHERVDTFPVPESGHFSATYTTRLAPGVVVNTPVEFDVTDAMRQPGAVVTIEPPMKLKGALAEETEIVRHPVTNEITNVRKRRFGPGLFPVTDPVEDEPDDDNPPQPDAAA